MKYLVCNLKNKMDYDDALKYCSLLNNVKNEKVELIIAPSSIYMPLFCSHKNIRLASQDISSFMDKTITGEISNEQLKSIGCSYVLVGHSERRQYKNEINIDFINKISNAQEVGLNVIYCIGESKKEKDNNETFNVLEKQISEVLNNVSLKNIIIAYEPVWAIGTGVVPKRDELQNTIEYIKDIVEEKYDDKLKVLYGGSVNENNIKDILSIKSLDGLLVGGYSLDVNNVASMLDIMNK